MSRFLLIMDCLAVFFFASSLGRAFAPLRRVLEKKLSVLEQPLFDLQIQMFLRENAVAAVEVSSSSLGISFLII